MAGAEELDPGLAQQVPLRADAAPPDDHPDRRRGVRPPRGAQGVRPDLVAPACSRSLVIRGAPGSPVPGRIMVGLSLCLAFWLQPSVPLASSSSKPMRAR